MEKQSYNSLELVAALEKLVEQQAYFRKIVQANVSQLATPLEHLLTSEAVQQLGRIALSPQLDQLAQKARDTMLGLGQFVADIAVKWGPVVTQVTRANCQAERLKLSGWLPHPSTPIGLTDECGDDRELLRKRVGEFYRTGWPSVKERMLQSVDRYDVDAESKDAFREALSAHEAGMYRCVCRVLFPEIERLARIELHAGETQSSITSQRKLRAKAGELGMSELELGGFLGLMLYERLERHLYAQAETEDARRAFENDPVPNRHCALHGLVSYRTAQNSLNTLFMVDYIFQVIHAAKRARPLAA